MISKELEIDDPVAERFQAFQAPYATVFKFLGRVHDAVIELQSNHWGISQMLHWDQVRLWVTERSISRRNLNDHLGLARFALAEAVHQWRQWTYIRHIFQPVRNIVNGVEYDRQMQCDKR